ncbi:MAG: transporter substrate-binding domain-containing protein [Spirochaetales bacterium]|nr:transporter substrate-binding domain-containing protein [Spirochaetales bacterium]
MPASRRGEVSPVSRCSLAREKTTLVFLSFLFCISIPSWALNTPKVQLSEDERSWLKENPDKLILYYNIEFPPLEFRSKTGHFTGIGFDVVKRIEEILDIRFIMVPSDDWNDHLEALKDGRCAVAPTIVKTEEREEYAFFTTPYAISPVVIITDKATQGNLSLSDLSGQRVGVVSGYATEAYLKDRSLLHSFTIVPLANVSQGLRSVSFGEVDAFIENLAVAAYYIEQEGISNLRVSGETDYAFSWSIGISRQYPFLYSAVQKALYSIPERSMAEIRNSWIAFEYPISLRPEVKWGLIFSAVFALFMILLLVIYSYFLKRRLEQKVIVLRESEERFSIAFNASPAPMSISEINTGRFINANKQFLAMVGYEAKDLLGRTSVDLGIWANPEDRKTMLTLYNQAGSIQEFPSKFKTKSGEMRDVLISTEVTHIQGETYLLAFFQDITERKLAEEALQKRLKEKDILLHEIHHRVKNNLSVISSLLNVQSDSIQSPEAAIKAFQDSKDRIMAMALLYEKMYASEDYSAIDLKEYLHDLSHLLLYTHRPDGNIQISVSTFDTVLHMDIAVPLGFILNELISNALLHAFPEQAAGIIFIDLREEGPGRCLLSVRDTGRGMVNIPEEAHTVGFTLIRLMTEQLGGTISVSPEGGTKITVSFPLDHQ